MARSCSTQSDGHGFVSSSSSSFFFSSSFVSSSSSCCSKIALPVAFGSSLPELRYVHIRRDTPGLNPGMIRDHQPRVFTWQPLIGCKVDGS